MSCKYLSKALNGNLRCKYKKQIITLQTCKNCLNFILATNKPISKRSSKLNKLEKERDKNLIKKGYCEYCGCYYDRLDPHEVYRRK